MTVFEKLQEVSSYAKDGKILLYCEGMFWKAYQEAAYLFTTCLKPYQVNKNYIKKIQTEVLSLGFPRPSTSKILSGYQYEEIDDRIVISVQNIEYSQEDYLKWRTTVVPQPMPVKRPAGDSLLVFKHAYDIQIAFYQINKNIDREYKFSLSEKIKEDMHNMIVNIYFANETDDDMSRKRVLIQNAIESLTSLKIRIRLLHDLKQISTKSFANLAVQITDLSEELFNWKKKHV